MLIRGVRSIHVTPIQVNFPCTVTQIDRQSTEKKTKQTHGKRIYLNSRSSEPPAQILYKISERWSVETRTTTHVMRLCSKICRCRTRNTAANLALLRGATLMIWKKTEPNRTAPDFIRSNQRNIDAKIVLINKNQPIGLLLKFIRWLRHHLNMNSTMRLSCRIIEDGLRNILSTLLWTPFIAPFNCSMFKFYV